MGNAVGYDAQGNPLSPALQAQLKQHKINQFIADLQYKINQADALWNQFGVALSAAQAKTGAGTTLAAWQDLIRNRKWEGNPVDRYSGGRGGRMPGFGESTSGMFGVTDPTELDKYNARMQAILDYLQRG